jgi:hypothetical protein
MKDSAKCKCLSPEGEIWRDPRKRYAWHFLPPFKDQFDSNYWWVGRPIPEPQAALYELVRRHPQVYLALLRRNFDQVAEYKEDYKRLNQPKVPLEAMVLLMGMVKDFAEWNGYSEAVAFLVLFGLKSWPKLSKAEKDWWRLGAGFIKGVDCRPEGERCYSIQEAMVRAAQMSPLVNALRARVRQAQGITNEAVGGGVPTPKNHEMNLSTGARVVGDVESFVAQEAIRAYRSGHILIAASPDLGYDGAERLLVRTYRNSHRLLRGSTGKQRARHQEWLKLIRNFEQLHPLFKKLPNAFNHYRRAIDTVRFPP